MVKRAPLSKPTNVIVAESWVFVPNKVFTVVALKLIWEPIIVWETLVPKVVVVVTFDACAPAVLIPIPVNVLINLTSEIVAEYPLVSYAWALPK